MSNLVTVANFHTLHEAEFAQTMLKSHGLASFVPDKHVASTGAPLSYGGVRLQVVESDVEKAKKLLKDL